VPHSRLPKHRSTTREAAHDMESPFPWAHSVFLGQDFTAGVCSVLSLHRSTSDLQKEEDMSERQPLMQEDEILKGP